MVELLDLRDLDMTKHVDLRDLDMAEHMDLKERFQKLTALEKLLVKNFLQKELLELLKIDAVDNLRFPERHF